MIKLDVSQLIAALQKAETFVEPETSQGTNYLYESVYESLLNGVGVRLSDLDFSAFDADDVSSLYDLYNDTISKNISITDDLARKLRGIAPAHKAAIYI